MTSLTPSTTISLRDGHTIPQLGFGLYQLTDPEETKRAIHSAIEAGYRQFDDAAAYKNEEIVGEALKESGVPREELYLTTKCWISDFGREKTYDSCRESLDRFGVDYLDLYLLHWPTEENLLEAWDALQRLQSEGLCRSIGVSNFTVARFEKGFFPHTDVIPAINQIESHPLRSQSDVQTYCEQKDIAIQAYSPLGQGTLLDHEDLSTIADSVGKTTAQVILRWHLQQNRIVIPKSATPSRIKENIDVYDFELSQEQMATITAMDRAESVITWKPNNGKNWY